MTSYHQPVLLPEALDGLDIQPAGTYVDATFGGGGHSRAILQRLGPHGRLIGFDQDKDAWRNEPQDSRFISVHQNFRHLNRFLKLHDALPVNGILADLGVSSHQFDSAARGFSTRFEGELDMRMDTRNKLTAAEVLNTYSEKALHKILERYGEVTNARSLATALVTARRSHPLHTTGELKAVLQPLSKGNPQRYLAQVFQALRIAVNDEMGALEDLLEQSVDALKPGGRLVIITFHSLEDRVVKQFMKTGGLVPDETDLFSTGTPEKIFRLITKKPVIPGREEQRTNPRSRSAKLRIAERLGE